MSKTLSDLVEKISASNSDILMIENNSTTNKITKENFLKEVNEQFNTITFEKATRQEVEVERKRIDNLATLNEGSTTGDAELIDLRVTVDGDIEVNAGSAVRKQFKDRDDDLYDYKSFIEKVCADGSAEKINNLNLLPDAKIENPSLWGANNCNLEFVTMNNSLSRGIKFTRVSTSLSARISINIPKSKFKNGTKYRIGFKQLYTTNNYKIALRENKGVINTSLNNYILAETLTTADDLYRYVDFTLDMSNSTQGYNYMDLQIISQNVDENTIFEIFIGEGEEDVKFSKTFKLKQQDVSYLENDINNIKDKLPKRIEYNENSVLSNFDDDSFWTIYNLTKTDSSDNLIAGNKTYFVTCPVNTNGIMTKIIDKDLSDSILSIHTYCEDISNLTACSIMISFDDTTFSKMAYCYITPTQDSVNTKTWLKHTITALDWTYQNGATFSDLSNVKAIRISLRSSANGSSTVGFDNFRICNKTLNEAGILFLFDDARKNIFQNAMPALDKYGYSATTYVITDYVGTTQTDSTGEIHFMDLKELRILRDKKWTIGSHTKTHNHLTQLDSQTLETVLKTSHDWLVDNGFKNGSNYLAYPFGEFNSNVCEVARKYYKCAFTTRERYFPEFSVNKMEIPRFEITSKKYTLEKAKEMIKTAFDKKLILPIYLHNIGDGLDWSKGEFEEIVDYINSLKMKVLTIDDLSKMFEFDND